MGVCGAEPGKPLSNPIEHFATSVGDPFHLDKDKVSVDLEGSQSRSKYGRSRIFTLSINAGGQLSMKAVRASFEPSSPLRLINAEEISLRVARAPLRRFLKLTTSCPTCVSIAGCTSF